MIKRHFLTNVVALLVFFVLLTTSSIATSDVLDDSSTAGVRQQLEDPEPPAPPKIPPNPVSEYLKKVHRIGAEVGEHPETLQAILLQETNGGRAERIGNRSSPVGKRSYGLMQVQVVAARSILQRYPEVLTKYFKTRTYKSLADEEIITLLLANDEANVRIAAYHFKLYLSLSNNNWAKAVAAYNMGIGNAGKINNHADVKYVREIKHKIDTVVRKFNQNHGL